MSKQPLWYTRRDNEIRGPFPAKAITRYILLGRISETDYLSTDQNNWKVVSSVTELIPAEMKTDQSIAENRERLRLARLREDERQAGDRRQTTDHDIDEDLRYKRSGEERREAETIETLRHREIKTESAQIIAKGQENYRFYYVALAVVIASIVIVSVMFAPGRPVAINNCNEPAKPNVNWSNCRLEGIKLAASNLEGAQLQNASLNSADLTGVKLSRAQMSYINMANANARNVNLSEAVLTGAVLRKSVFVDGNLRDADLSFAILQEVDLSGADLTNANLTQAVLNGAIIINTKLKGAVLDNAIWIDNSVCAPGSVGKCIAAN